MTVTHGIVEWRNFAVEWTNENSRADGFVFLGHHRTWTCRTNRIVESLGDERKCENSLILYTYIYMLEISTNYLNCKGYRIEVYVFYLKHNSQWQLMNCIKRLACYPSPIEELFMNWVLCTIDPIYLNRLTVFFSSLEGWQNRTSQYQT